jgi:hypothetical protein
MAKKDWLDRLFHLNSRMLSTEFEAEAATCRQNIKKLLNQHGKSANDIAELLDIVQKRRAPPAPPQAPTTPPRPPGDPITALELFEGVRAVLREYLSLEDDEYTVCALWCMHSHVYRQFMHTPRLIFSAALRDCGKTTALDVNGGFVPHPKMSDHMTAATFFRAADRCADFGGTLLLDEVDNLGLLTNPVFRAALNSGYRRGGTIDRTIRGQLVSFKTFAPLVLAGIGTVPLPLARRSIVILLQRDPKAPITRKQFDSEDEQQIEMFGLILAHLSAWAADCKLDRKPSMPEQLTGGQCDNWRPLISVADACSAQIGELARAIAVKMCRNLLNEDFEVLLLRDIRDLFDQKRANRLTSAVIVDHLNSLPHGLWVDWRGKDDTDAPRPMTAAIMAKLLQPFRIRPATIWPLNRNAETKSSRGYHRFQFEDAWTRYCEPDADTPTHSPIIRSLHSR